MTAVLVVAATLLAATSAAAWVYRSRVVAERDARWEAERDAELVHATAARHEQDAKDLALRLRRAVRTHAAEVQAHARTKDLLDTTEERVLTERIPLWVFSAVVAGTTVHRDVREVDRAARSLSAGLPASLDARGLVLRSDHQVEFDRVQDGSGDVVVRLTALASPRLPYPPGTHSEIQVAPRLAYDPSTLDQPLVSR